MEHDPDQHPLPESPAAAPFLLRLGLFVGTLAVIIVAGTVAVDPYATFGSPRIAGFNSLKINSEADRMVKAAALRQGSFDGLLVGTSQAQYGLDPERPAIRKLAKRTYNAGLVAANPYQLLRYLQVADRDRTLRSVVIVVDLLLFNEKEPEKQTSFGFNEARLPAGPDGRAQPYAALADLPGTAFSLDAIKLAVRTVTHQTTDSEWLKPTGLLASENLRRDLWSKGGPRRAFEESEKRYAGWFRGFTLEGREKGPTALGRFEQLLQHCMERDLQVTVLVAPAHARYFQLLEALELVPQAEELKRRLVALLARVSEKAGRPPMPLWDFGSANETTGESVPREMDPSAKMRWYFDAVHFNPDLGDRVIAEIMSGEAAASEGLGIALTPQNVEQALRGVRASQAAYARSHPTDVEQVRAAVKAARSEKTPSPQAPGDASPPSKE